ncbi:MAG: phytoene/squalene synthase family protein [Candidatus Saccharimonadales bacterium]
MSQERTIFKNGSTTFFISSLFFPHSVRANVFDLYSFVRVADDYVDQVPADSDSFYRLRQLWTEAADNLNYITDKSEDDSTDERVVKNMVRVARKNKFDLAWVEAFLDAMQSDIKHTGYRTIEDTLGYMYGSAEVVGLMMARLMGLKPEAAQAAQLQGRAMQLINFIRDITEDIDLGRQYFPADELKRFNLPDLTHETATQRPQDFTKFIQFQLNRYDQWQHEAYQGYKYIPRRLRIPLQTATDMYKWTANEIHKDPLVIYEKKIKPSKMRVISRVLMNAF